MPSAADPNPDTAGHCPSTLSLPPARAQTPPAGSVAQLDAILASALAGRFRVERVLGIGASGVVFRAFDHEAEQRVAIKVLHRREPRALYRLKREFRQLVEISHPNLVAVHELFVAPSGHAFFTMDLVEDALSFSQYHRASAPGGDATDRLRASFTQLVHGVQELHAHKKLHRDLKPSNVLIDAERHLRIVDFELMATLHEPSFGAADRPIFEGTPAYAAPEQIDVRRTSPASDWYSVGVMLYEVLADVRPFEGAGSDLLQLKAASEPLPPSRFARAPVPPELEEVCMRLLAPDPAKRADGSDLLRALGESSRPSRPRRSSRAWPFVGRERELERLERAFATAREGDPGPPMLIEGSSGSGKTSLVRRFLAQLEASGRALVLQGRCYVAESIRYNALDGIVDALVSTVSQLSAAEVQQLLPADIGALAQLFPVVRELVPEEPASASLHSYGARAAAVAALRELLVGLSQVRPVVLFVDDLHWADADSARVFCELFETPLPRVWLLGTFRRAALAAREVEELERVAALARSIALEPLETEAVTSLARQKLPDCTTSVVDEIAVQSGGDAWLAQVLIQHASAHPVGGREDVSADAALRDRLADLTPCARELLERMCVAGGRLPRSLFLDAAATSMTALHQLRRSSSARESLFGGIAHLEPYHDRVRELVLAEMSVSRRTALHHWLAERLESHGSAYLDQAAQHYERAGMHDRARTAAEVAARDATAACAFHSAADLMELALRCAATSPERHRLQLAAAEACARAGRVLAAARHYEAAASAAAEPKQRFDLQLQAVTAYCTSGRGRKGRELLQRSAAELGLPIDFEPMTVTAGARWMLRVLLFGAPKLRPAAARLPPPAAGDQAALRLLWQSAPAVMVVDPELACQFAVRAMIKAAAQNDTAVYGQALAFQLAVFVLVLGRSSWLIERRFVQAQRLARHTSDPWSERLVLVMYGSTLAIRGDYEATVALCGAIAHEDTLRTTFGAAVRSGARALVMMSLLKLGRLNEFAQHVELWQAEALDTGDRHIAIACRILGTQRHLRSNNIERALRDVEAARATPLDYVHPGFAEPWWLVQLALYRGAAREAQALFEASRHGQPTYIQQTAALRLTDVMTDGLCAAALAADGGDVAVHVRRLAEALRRAQRIRATGAAACVAQLAATLAKLRGERELAQSHLRRAIRAYGASKMALHVASMRLALADLLPCDAASLAQAASEAFAAEGVRDPRRWAAMVAPGLVRP